MIDSTGVQVYGADQWRALRSAERIERECVKLHAVRDLDTGEILDWALTRSDGYGSGDANAGARMLNQLIDEGLEIENAYADGAYDSKWFRQAVWRGGGQAIIPPPKHATLSRGYEHGQDIVDWQSERDAQVLGCARDRKVWKQEAGYHVRSTVETTMNRLKTLFGEGLATSNPERQRLDIALRVELLNQHLVRSLA